MARRYRYSFTKKKEAGKGKVSVTMAVISLILFCGAVTAAFLLEGQYGFVTGGVCLFAALLSIYGFIMGLLSFSEAGKGHKTSIIGSITNGIIMILWLGIYLTGG